MWKHLILTCVLLFAVTVELSCQGEPKTMTKFTGAKGEVKLMTLDPGHFHAALVQKFMYDEISPNAYVYAPAGDEVRAHLNLIESFNKRPDNPTAWNEITYIGPDFFQKMLAEKPGNVVVLAGNNKEKTEYIKACVDNGLNVLADKPMAIDKKDFTLLQDAFNIAEKKGVLIYDIMTERFEINTIIQKELSNNPEVFGVLEKGTVENPAIIRESSHHFSKKVAGNQLIRPAWFFDTTQQGEGIVDVTTHLVDLAMWGSFPNQAINYKTDLDLETARRWPTLITKEQFEKVTKLPEFPDYLKPALDEKGVLNCYSNGEFVFQIKGVNIKVGVVWNFEAAVGTDGTGDTLYSLVRGTKANIMIKQGKEQNFEPKVYVEPVNGTNPADLEKALNKAVAEINKKYPGVAVEKQGGLFHVSAPQSLHIGHEQHFRQVMLNYLKYLREGKMPAWEVPNMIAKYYVTTKALEMASQK